MPCPLRRRNRFKVGHLSLLRGTRISVETSSKHEDTFISRIMTDLDDEDSFGTAFLPPRAVGHIVRTGPYYETFYGHNVTYIRAVSEALRMHHGPRSSCIWLAGDSSLDNKAWLFDGLQSEGVFERDFARGRHGRRFIGDALNGYETILHPPGMVQDVCYWMNEKLMARNSLVSSNTNEVSTRTYCINTAVEATTLTSRTGGCEACCMCTCGDLLESDKYIRDHCRAQDMIVVSIGGNDIALAPSIITVLFLFLIVLTPSCLLVKYNPIVFYFIILFRHQVTKYLEKITSKQMPAKIGVCCIYYLDEHNGESWANCALLCLGYCCCPSVLQQRIKVIFQLATCEVKLESSHSRGPAPIIVPIALSDALDGKTTGDYVQRVEPSIAGGEKIASLIVQKMMK